MPRSFSFSLSLVLALAACSGTSHERDDAGAAPDAAEPCLPRSCASIDAECGTIDDGCGGTLACGGCAPTERCGVETANRCGGECTTDAHCAHGLHCDVASATCREGCRTSTDVTVDLPRVEVALEVRLDGGPMPPSSGDSPSLHFHPVGLPDLGARVHLYEDGVARAGVVLSLSPGPHEVQYYVSLSSDDGAWPQNGYTSLGVVDIAPDATSLVIDVPRVRVELAAHMGGEVVPPVPDASDVSLPGLLLVHESGGEVEVPLHGEAVGDERPPRPELGAWVIPGTYDLLYLAGDDLEPWPRNRWTPLQRELDLRADRTGDRALAVDHEAVSFEVVATVGGAPMPSAGSATLALVADGSDPVRTGGSAFVPLRADTTAAERTARVLPGRYELWYVAGSEPQDGWPRFTAPLGPIELTEDTVLPLDIPVTEIELAVELEGATSTDDACLSSLRVGPEAFWNSGELELTSPASPFPAETVWAIPGAYRVTYLPGWDCVPGEWPAVRGESELSIPPEGGAITMRIPRRRLRVGVSLDGARPPPLAAGESPALLLMRGDWRSEPLPLFRDVGEGLEPADVSAFVEPGTYDLYYAGAGDHAASWPWAPAVLRRDLEIVEDVDLDVDIRRTPIQLRVTTQGQPLAYPADPPWAFDFSPNLYLSPRTELDWRHPSVALDLFGRDPPLDTFEGYLVPGTYHLFRAIGFGFASRAESDFPATGARLGCWAVPPP